MLRRFTVAVSVLVVLALAAPGGGALFAQLPGEADREPLEESADGPVEVESQLARLNRTLERIAGLLERQIEGQRLDLTLKRLELGNQRIQTLESELRQAEEKKRSLEDRQYEVQSRLKMFEDELERMEPEQIQDNRGSFTIMVGQAERELDVIEARLQETRRRILELENEVTRRRDDLRSLQDGLDRELGGR